MGNLTLNGATSGQITLAPPSVAGTNTLTLPAKTGNIITSADTGTVSQAMLAIGVAGNGPAFSAYRGTSAQSVTSGVWTKVQLNSEDFDTNNCFDNTTNYRFTPNVAGYYQINAALYPVSSGSANYIWCNLYKNGVASVYGTSAGAASVQDGVSVLSTLIYMNGTTDYIELYGYVTGTSPTIPSGGFTYLSGFLARAA